MAEYPQTIPALTAATSNLFDLIRERRLALYPDPGMRLAASRAVLVESSRGQRLDKTKQAHHIDVIVALSLAALAAVKNEGSSYSLWSGWLDDGDEDEQMNTKALPTPSWKLGRFQSEAEAKKPTKRVSALYTMGMSHFGTEHDEDKQCQNIKLSIETAASSSAMKMKFCATASACAFQCGPWMQCNVTFMKPQKRWRSNRRMIKRTAP